MLPCWGRIVKTKHWIRQKHFVYSLSLSPCPPSRFMLSSLILRWLAFDLNPEYTFAALRNEDFVLSCVISAYRAHILHRFSYDVNSYHQCYYFGHSIYSVYRSMFLKYTNYSMIVGIIHVYYFHTGQIYVGVSKSVGIVVLILSYLKASRTNLGETSRVPYSVTRNEHYFIFSIMCNLTCKGFITENSDLLVHTCVSKSRLRKCKVTRPKNGSFILPCWKDGIWPPVP